MSEGFLVMRRDGVLCALAAGEVAGIDRASTEESAKGDKIRPGGAQGLELRLTDGRRLAVESVLTLATDLRIRPLSPRLRRFLPAGSGGLSIHAGEPLLVLAPERRSSS